MKTCEPECVAIKRSGAEYVATLLANKTRQEKLEFWRKRTETLLLLKSQLQSNRSAR